MTTDPGHWVALARSADLGAKPLRVMWEGEPLVLFRSAQGVAALTDRCPHRFVELSKGKVVEGEIECPYHGWRFGGDGACTAIPGLCEALPPLRVRRFRAVEHEGAIFVASGTPEGQPYSHCLAGQNIVTRVVRSSTRSTLIDAAENILDATHTHFTHKGVLRGLSAKRYRVKVEVTGGPGWVEASYEGEEEQHGLISKLLEGARMKTVGRFLAPGIAELEYWGPKGMVLATSFHLRQADADTVEGVGWLAGPHQGGLGHLKALFFKPLFRVALEQDRRVLASARANAVPGQKPVIGPLDFLRRDIAKILDGEMPAAAAAPRVHYIEL